MTNDTKLWARQGRIAASERWERQSAAMGRGVTDTIVEFAAPAPGMHVLDLASGTGAPAIPLARTAARVVATDVNHEPLRIARTRATERSLANLRFAVVDAHALPFVDAAFDLVTSRYGVMFFRDVVRAFREARRVLRPGGRIALITWGREGQPYHASMAGVVHQLIGGPMWPVGPFTPYRFADPESLAAPLRAAGFHDVHTECRTVEWAWPGAAEELWEYFREVTTPCRALIDRIPPARAPEINTAVLASLRRYQRGDQIAFGAEVVLAGATA